MDDETNKTSPKINRALVALLNESIEDIVTEVERHWSVVNDTQCEKRKLLSLWHLQLLWRRDEPYLIVSGRQMSLCTRGWFSRCVISERRIKRFRCQTLRPRSCLFILKCTFCSFLPDQVGVYHSHKITESSCSFSQQLVWLAWRHVCRQLNQKTIISWRNHKHTKFFAVFNSGNLRRFVITSRSTKPWTNLKIATSSGIEFSLWAKNEFF